MANLKSEQIRADLSLDEALDDKLSKKEMQNVLISALGKENCHLEQIANKKLLVFNSVERNKKIVLLYASITYLGGNGQHPIYKKRIQLKTWYKEIVHEVQNNHKYDNYDVKFIGVYHYKGNVIFVDFVKESYMKKKMNNSAAHVYINDLYQGIKNGVFKKIDQNNNIIFSMNFNSLNKYLNSSIVEESYQPKLINDFQRFNESFPFKTWIKSSYAIPEMYFNNFSQWKQGEWPGWYLEYLFDKYIKENNIEFRIKYIALSNKKSDDFDFDLFFEEDDFFGDLKASDIKKTETPGNDQETFAKCINKHEKFWYIIYEHETLKDKDSKSDYEATRFRTKFIKEQNEWDSRKPWDPLSYYSRMKHSVNFKRMMIVELNRINFRNVLSDFNQGKQPSGESRKPKFKLDKGNIDNFVIFRYQA
jgi:hypothetical protein